jgi:hypothetical protein
MAARPIVPKLKGQKTKAKNTKTKAKKTNVTRRSGPLHALGDEQFADLMKRLLSREAAACGLAQDQHRSTKANNFPDGGVDYLVEGTPPRPSDWLRGPTAFQFKLSRPKVADLFKEISDSPDLIARLEKGFRYILLVASEMDPPGVDDLQVNLARRLKERLSREIAVEVRPLDKLVNWLGTYLALLGSLPSVPSGFGALRNWDAWRDEPSLGMEVNSLPFIPDLARREAGAQIRRVIAEAGTLRLEGSPGVGKSRLALEAVEFCKEDVRYLADDDPGVVDGLLSSAVSGVLKVASSSTSARSSATRP